MIIKEIVEQHADNLFYLWNQRDHAAVAPNYKLYALANLDERVEANRLGLMLGDEYGWTLCEQALETRSPGEIFGAAVFALESQDISRINTVVDFIGDNRKLQRAFISALGWLPFEKVSPFFEQLLVNGNPAKKRLGISGLVKHGMDPGVTLGEMVTDKDPFLKSRAIEAAGELGRVDLKNVIMRSVNHEDQLTRFASCWTLGRFGEHSTAIIETLKTFCRPDFGYCERAVALLTNILPEKACHEWIEGLVCDDKRHRLGIIAIRERGDPWYIPILFEYMLQENLARVSGEAFSWISGIDLENDNFEGEKPEGYKAGPSDDPEDDNVATDSDDDLFWPNVEKMKGWWEKNRNNFSSHTRYLRGRETSPEQYRTVLMDGNQCQRAATALRIAIDHPDDIFYEVRAPGKIQQYELTV